MITITPQELEPDMARYFDRVKAGETLVIQPGYTPVLDPETAETLRPIGLAAGEFVVPDDFDDPLPEEFMRYFEPR